MTMLDVADIVKTEKEFYEYNIYRVMVGEIKKTGKQIVVEKIETEKDVRKVYVYADYLQGYLFGKPDVLF